MPLKPIICIDFDGVLNNYNGYDGDNLGTPRPGAKEFLEKLSKKYIIIILSARRYSHIIRWLNHYDLWQYVSDVTSFKTKNVVCFVDDRAMLKSDHFGIEIEIKRKTESYKHRSLDEYD